MKFTRRIVLSLTSLIMIINVSLFSTVYAFAHNTLLNVGYDNCSPDDDGDSKHETWYDLEWGTEVYHISHTVTTIKYYFADSLPGSDYTWTSDVSYSEAQEIKDAYANSMKSGITYTSILIIRPEMLEKIK